MEQHADKYLGKKLEGRYEIQELIGMGGMANVYKAFDVIDRRTVSVKILRDEYLGNAEFLRRFKNESKAIAVLNHPNIVQVYDVSFTNQMQSIIMEYIDGITLKDYIERLVTLNWKEAIHFTLQILQALAHAHEKGIVHRDIKPHNIMLLQNGDIKVTDFGIARFARSEVKTITDRAIGSVHYISPEQAMGDNTDQKSDIYSVGVMLFEMLTGKVPFEADSAVSVAIKHIQSKAVRPTQINPTIPKGLEEITLKAMEKDSALRYQSAQAMIDDIEKFKQDPSIQFHYKYLGSDNNQAARKKYRRAISQTREEKPLSKQRRKKRVPYIPILAGVTFAFILASLGFIGLMISLYNPFAPVEEFPAPDLVGLRFDTAQRQYAAMNVEIEIETEMYHNEFAPGVIFYQDPRPGRMVREGVPIQVRVSRGQTVIHLDNYENQEVNRVRSALAALGLEYEVRHTYDSNIPVGHVIFTNPSVGAEVRSGSSVILHVSLGPDVVWRNVPDVRGMTIGQAQQMLEFFNLRVGDVTEQQGSEPAGTVIAQEPMDGTMQIEGTPISLIISRGEEFRRGSIPVPLPAIDELMLFQAYQDGVLVQEEMLNPWEVGTWRPVITGSDRVVFVQILVDGELFRQYNLDFSDDPPSFYEVGFGVGSMLLP